MTDESLTAWQKKRSEQAVQLEIWMAQHRNDGAPPAFPRTPSGSTLREGFTYSGPYKDNNGRQSL